MRIILISILYLCYGSSLYSQDKHNLQMHLNNIRLLNVPVTLTESKETISNHLSEYKKHLDSISSQNLLNDKDFFYNIFFADFDRSNWVIFKRVPYKEDGRYVKRINGDFDKKDIPIFLKATQNLTTEEKNQKIQEVFMLINEVLHSEGKIPQNQAREIQKNIALALATRSQTFEFVATKYLLMNLYEIGNTVYGIDTYEPITYKVTIDVKTHDLLLEATSVYQVTHPDQDRRILAYFKYRRVMAINSLTGEMTDDKIILTRGKD